MELYLSTLIIIPNFVPTVCVPACIFMCHSEPNQFQIPAAKYISGKNIFCSVNKDKTKEEIFEGQNKYFY